MEKIINITIEELDFSPLTYICLKCANINTVEDLIVKNREELLEIKNFKDINLEEVINKLATIGLDLK